MRARIGLGAALLALPVMSPAMALEPFAVVGDAIPAPLGGLDGDVRRGEALVRDRERGNCLICHQGADPSEPFQGSIGPPLA
ncbi:MAG: sulfur oxidation c-type cytochrome SoxX, partial [Bosea sp. (in: a-proteobacteria)]|nr:sulfur oxidation c-type cytochrome SoxX [Bosea sp. (in: a-proteobacteria)]